MLAIAAPSRHDSPELAHLVPGGPLTLDAEMAPQLIAERFVDVEIDAWDSPLLILPTPASVCDYLVGRQVAPDHAATVARAVDTPLSVTKRGAVVFARKTR